MDFKHSILDFVFLQIRTSVYQTLVEIMEHALTNSAPTNVYAQPDTQELTVK